MEGTGLIKCVAKWAGQQNSCLQLGAAQHGGESKPTTQSLWGICHGTGHLMTDKTLG